MPICHKAPASMLGLMKMDYTMEPEADEMASDRREQR
jgi:hypothetical protein